MLKNPHHLRVLALSGIFLMLAGGVIWRLSNLQIQNHDRYYERARRQQVQRVVLQPERGDILDRQGRSLAQSTSRLTVYINPRYFQPPHFTGGVERVALAISDETDMPIAQVLQRLQSSRTTALASRMREADALAIMDVFGQFGLDGRGYWLHRESVRQYPRRIASAVLGYCTTDGDGDNQGMAGLELRYDEELSGKRIEGTTGRTGISQAIQPFEESDILAARGNTLKLTLDAIVQETAEDALRKAVAEFEAKSAGVVVMNPQTGAILAMAVHPTFDNNEFSRFPNHLHGNRLLTDPLETGSVAKLFTAGILLDLGLVGLNTMIDCEGGRAVVNGRRLTDSHKMDKVSFLEVMRWSSNIGINKVAQELDNNIWYDYLRKFGFGQRTGIDLPGEDVGLLYPVSRWTRLSRTSLPMGYEMALTPIQIAVATSSLVNGGWVLEPYLVEEIISPSGEIIFKREPKRLHHVVSPSTSFQMRYIMEDIGHEGSGRRAIVNGYRIGGKTGTTRKSNILDRREYISSFAGAVPMNDPQVLIYTYVDAPQGAYYASIVAAPIFREVARTALMQLGIPPTESSLAEIENLIASSTVEIDEASSPHLEEGSFQDFAAPWQNLLMPDFRGLSMAQVRSRLPKEVKAVRFEGSGVAVEQRPQPGIAIGSQTEITVIFSSAMAQEGRDS